MSAISQHSDSCFHIAEQKHNNVVLAVAQPDKRLEGSAAPKVEAPRANQMSSFLRNICSG